MRFFYCVSVAISGLYWGVAEIDVQCSDNSRIVLSGCITVSNKLNNSGLSEDIFIDDGLVMDMKCPFIPLFFVSSFSTHPLFLLFSLYASSSALPHPHLLSLNPSQPSAFPLKSNHGIYKEWEVVCGRYYGNLQSAASDLLRWGGDGGRRSSRGVSESPALL